MLRLIIAVEIFRICFLRFSFGIPIVFFFKGVEEVLDVGVFSTVFFLACFSFLSSKMNSDCVQFVNIDFALPISSELKI